MARERVVDGVTYTFTECITCGISYSLPTLLFNQQVLKGGFHTCPSGHSQGWPKEESTEARLKRERDNAIQQIARAEQEAKEALQRAERAEASSRLLKKRTSAGTCPCCKRTFANMAEHMKHQHPEFVAAGGAKVVPIKRRRRTG